MLVIIKINQEAIRFTFLIESIGSEKEDAMLTNEEAKKLLFEETPVLFRGSEYLKINALIYRRYKQGVRTSAEILDKNRKCIVVAPIEWLDKGGSEKYETFRTDELEEAIEKAKLIAADFFEEAGKEKAITAQEKLYLLIRNLLEVDSMLRVEVNEIERVEAKVW